MEGSLTPLLPPSPNFSFSLLYAVLFPPYPPGGEMSPSSDSERRPARGGGGGESGG